MEVRTPIALITGALGSGKTTLLRQLLVRAERRLAVLMNEFGEIAIDSRILPGENLRIIELAGGCVCCELSGEFEAAIDEILDRFHPELIVVEATGVAEADALALEVQENLPQVRLDSVIHVVDAYAAIEHPEIGYTARSQLRQADVILVNKTDLVEPDAIRQVGDQVRRFNERAVLHPCVRCGVDLAVLFGGCGDRPAPDSAPHAVPGFDSFSFTTNRILDRSRFERWVAALPADVFRAKGFVCFPGGTFLFNYVAGRTDWEPFPAELTELVCIGPRLAEVQDNLLESLRSCEV
jgi:G3E family GTPase